MIYLINDISNQVISVMFHSVKKAEDHNPPPTHNPNKKHCVMAIILIVIIPHRVALLVCVCVLSAFTWGNPNYYIALCAYLFVISLFVNLVSAIPVGVLRLM